MKLFETLLLIGGGALVGHSIGSSIGKSEDEKRDNGIAGALLGAVITGRVIYVLGKTHNTVNYILKNKNKRVYDGIAFDHRLEARLNEHIYSGKKFDEVIIDNPKPRTIALNLERKRIKRFIPKYSIQHNCAI